MPTRRTTVITLFSQKLGDLWGAVLLSAWTGGARSVGVVAWLVGKTRSLGKIVFSTWSNKIGLPQWHHHLSFYTVLLQYWASVDSIYCSFKFFMCEQVNLRLLNSAVNKWLSNRTENLTLCAGHVQAKENIASGRHQSEDRAFLCNELLRTKAARSLHISCSW